MRNSQRFLKFIYFLSVWSFIGLACFLLLSQGYLSSEQSAFRRENATVEEVLAALDGVAADEFEVVLDVDREINDDPQHRSLEVQSHISSLPLEYWYRNSNFHLGKSPLCARYPSIFDLKFSNTYWQVLESSNGTFHFLNAFYDNRPLSPTGATIRVLGMIDRVQPAVRTTCQMWFEGERKPVFAAVFEYRYMWVKEWGSYKNGVPQPYLMFCKMPAGYEQRVPYSVSVVENPCDTAMNNLRVINNVLPAGERKKEFAVCVKGLDFFYQDLSVMLVEWIEVILALGADKIFLYDLSVHPNMTKVLNYYQSAGKVEVTSITLPGTQPNIQGFHHAYLSAKMGNKRLDEVIPYNDCFYRHMHRYDYIALLDIDEVIVPTNNATTWQELMRDTLKVNAANVYNQPHDSFSFRNGLFRDLSETNEQIPSYLRFLQTTHRMKVYPAFNAGVKCFHDTQRIVTLHNHYPRSCVGTCHTYSVPVEDAHMQHYCFNKGSQKACRASPNDTVVDTSLWKIKEQVIPRATEVLGKLGFLKKRRKSA